MRARGLQDLALCGEVMTAAYIRLPTCATRAGLLRRFLIISHPWRQFPGFLLHRAIDVCM